MSEGPNLALALENRVERTPDRIFLSTPGSAPVSFREFNSRVNRLAHGLQKGSGVRSGECVALMSRNCDEYIVVSYALKKIGAIEAAINTDFRGPGLAHVLNLTNARVLVIEAELLEFVLASSRDLPDLRIVYVRGKGTDQALAASSPWCVASLEDVYSDNESDLSADLRNDISAILFHVRDHRTVKGVRALPALCASECGEPH